MSHTPGFHFLREASREGCLLRQVGLIVRPAAMVMVINFVAALVIAHRDTPHDAARLALCVLFSSLFLLFNGAGALSLDNHLGKGRR